MAPPRPTAAAPSSSSSSPPGDAVVAAGVDAVVGAGVAGAGVGAMVTVADEVTATVGGCEKKGNVTIATT